ncbi:hypothetical protein Tco_1257631 [Tanacetum coccineum]
MANTSQEEESFNPLEIRHNLFSYKSPACLKFEQDTRNYDTNDPQNEIAEQTNPLLDKGGLTKRWHVCKPVQVFYNDETGEDYGMWPTCNPDSSFCYGCNEVFRKSKQGMLRQWILDSFGVEEEYAKEIKNPYSRRFNEYKRVFDNEVENLSNEYNLRIGKIGYALDDVWEKCEQYHKKLSILDTMLDMRKKNYGEGAEFICITKQDDDTLPLGRVNGARFKEMIRKELKDKGIAQDET